MTSPIGAKRQVYRREAALTVLLLSRPCSLGRVPFCHFAKETLLLEFLEKTEIDKLLRLGALRLGHLRREHIQQKLNAFEGGIRFLWNRLDSIRATRPTST